MKFSQVLFLITNVLLSLSTVFSKEEGKTWAVLVAGYDLYTISYAFEGAVYKMYGTLIDQGIPAEQIITISPDTAAFHPKNRNPGAVTYARDAGQIETFPNYYEDVIIDYRNMITVDLFFEILKGNKTDELLEIGSGKVLSSGPKDNVYIFYLGFGFWNYFSIARFEYISSEEIVPLLEHLQENKHFKKLFWIFDSDDPGMSFDDYLDTDKNILVYSLGGRFDWQYYCHFNKDLKCFTSTCAGFAVHTYTEKSLGTSGGKELINDHFANTAYLGSNINIVHNLYGQLENGNEPIGNYMGFGTTSKHSSKKHPEQLLKMDIEEMRKFIVEQTKNRTTLEEIIKEDETIPQNEKDRVEEIVTSIIDQSLHNADYSKSIVGSNQQYGHVLNNIRSKCFTKKNEILFFLHVRKFSELFNLNISPEKIYAAVKNIC